MLRTTAEIHSHHTGWILLLHVSDCLYQTWVYLVKCTGAWQINVWHSKKKKTFKLLTVWIEKDALILMETQSFILVRVLFFMFVQSWWLTGAWLDVAATRHTWEWLPSETTRASSFHSTLSKNSVSRLVVARPYAPVCKIVPYLLVLPQVLLTPLSPARSCSAFPRCRLPPAEMNLEHLPVSVSVLGSTHLNLTILSTDWLLSYTT